MTTRKVTLTRLERKARYVALAEEQFDLLCPDDHAEANVYSTETPDLWPRRARSRRHARDLIRGVPGHERYGAGRETIWRVDAEAYRKHYAQRPLVKVPASAPARTDQVITDEAIADRALVDSGLRATRRTGS